MNKEVEETMKLMLGSLKQSREYLQYQEILEALKREPDLYARIGDFRRRSIAMQMQDGVDMIQENNNLERDFGDLKTNGLANDFLIAEHEYCMMIREIQDLFLKEVDLDTGFLED